MKFRPCIDIHNGQVKQIVGGTLQDEGNNAVENFASQKDAEYFAALYKQQGLNGGHVIMLNASNSDFYPATSNKRFLPCGNIRADFKSEVASQTKMQPLS